MMEGVPSQPNKNFGRLPESVWTLSILYLISSYVPAVLILIMNRAMAVGGGMPFSFLKLFTVLIPLPLIFATFSVGLAVCAVKIKSGTKSIYRATWAWLVISVVTLILYGWIIVSQLIPIFNLTSL